MRGCPKCLSPDDLSTIETIPGYAGIVSVCDDGEVIHTGYTDVDWNMSRTDGVRCEACGWESWVDDWLDLLVILDDDRNASPTSD